jgi:hypothetical protein
MYPIDSAMIAFKEKYNLSLFKPRIDLLLEVNAKKIYYKFILKFDYQI